MANQQPQFLEDAFQQELEEMMKTFIKKHQDYGKGNVLDTGELGILFRINDKINRLKHLLNNGKDPANESLNETWHDIAVYAVIALVLRKGWFKKLKLKAT